MRTRLQRVSVLSLAIGALSLGGYSDRADATLTDDIANADCGLGPTNNCLTFGDFNVFSLPLLQLRDTGDSVPGPGDDYHFSSTYGAIQDYTIIGINNGQSTDTGNPPGTGPASTTGVDGSYNTPSANNVNVFTTQTLNPGGVDDPGDSGPAASHDAEFIGDGENTWDARTTTLLDLIDGTPLVAFFAFNETGSGTGLETTDLLVWAKVTLFSDSGASVDFYLGGTTEPSTAAADLPDVNSVADASGRVGPWVYVHAGICADNAGNFLGFPVNGVCAVGSVRNQNDLGQNAAAFAINSPALDAALESGNYDYMQVLWKMAYINGGGETAWIQSSDSPTTVPEPAALGLLGLGLLSLAVGAGSRRRRNG